MGKSFKGLHPPASQDRRGGDLDQFYIASRAYGGTEYEALRDTTRLEPDAALTKLFLQITPRALLSSQPLFVSSPLLFLSLRLP